jgi:hypothetical protein
LNKCAAILRIRRSFSRPASALVPSDLFIHGAAFPPCFPRSSSHGFKAVNAHDRNITSNKLDKRIQQVDQCIERYLSEMETADRQALDVAEARVTRLKEKIATPKARMETLKQIRTQLEEVPDGQISLTDPDARAMATGTSRGLVGYNVERSIFLPTVWQQRAAAFSTTLGRSRRSNVRVSA